jgi:hypothetical protein
MRRSSVATVATVEDPPRGARRNRWWVRVKPGASPEDGRYFATICFVETRSSRHRSVRAARGAAPQANAHHLRASFREVRTPQSGHGSLSRPAKTRTDDRTYRCLRRPSASHFPESPWAMTSNPRSGSIDPVRRALSRPISFLVKGLHGTRLVRGHTRAAARRGPQVRLFPPVQPHPTDAMDLRRQVVPQFAN